MEGAPGVSEVGGYGPEGGYGEFGEYRTANVVSRGGSARGRSFAGRGPKGYRRSDTRIAEDVSEALTRDPEVDASDIDVHVQDGEVTLTGTVSDRRTKRRAEDDAAACSGVRDVHNRLTIAERGDPGLATTR
jgi:osmotically-inducible protein OsmY